jgi:hypothetical protein
MSTYCLKRFRKKPLDSRVGRVYSVIVLKKGTDMTTAIACYCPLCDLPIWEASFARGEVADNHVFKCGELSYIELAHAKCARNDLTREWEFE